MALHQSLPVHGYQRQTSAAVDLVNRNKIMEERVLRLLDELAATGSCDPRWLAIGRTAIEQGFIAINRAVFQPERVTIPGDDDTKPGGA